MCQKIKVLVVDDSAMSRGLWAKVINAQTDMEVTSFAVNGEEAIKEISLKDLDTVILDLEMPVMDGITALPKLLQIKPQLKILIVSHLSQKGSEMAMKALMLGAADYIPKPSCENNLTLEDVSSEIVLKIRTLCRPKKNNFKNKHVDAIVIGASTGGPNALSQVMSELKTILPIFIVQHMPPSFVESFVERLKNLTGKNVVLATHGAKVESSTVYIAPGNFHMALEKGSHDVKIKLHEGPLENFCRPAVDQLFCSGSVVYEQSILAVILTGMGEDGKKGCMEIKKRGGLVLAQDETSSVVWGMPGAVVRSGLADYVVALKDIPRSIHHLLRNSNAS